MTLPLPRAALMPLAACALFALASPAPAQVANSSFESGFTGWTTVGSAAVVTSSFGRTPPDGTQQAFLSNDPTNGSVPAATLESSLGLTAGALTGLGNGTVVNGSGLFQTFSGLAGETLSLQYDFLTSEDPNFPPYNNDFAFVSLGGLTTLATVAQATVAEPPQSGLASPSIDDYLTETGPLTYTATLPTTGSYALGLGVVNVGTGDIASGLLVDNVTLRPAAAVPEPAPETLLLAVLVAGAPLLALRRRTARS